jgi:hypothetical protein
MSNMFKSDLTGGSIARRVIEHGFWESAQS